MFLVFLFRIQAILFYVHIFQFSKLYLSIISLLESKNKNTNFFFLSRLKKKILPCKEKSCRACGWHSWWVGPRAEGRGGVSWNVTFQTCTPPRAPRPAWPQIGTFGPGRVQMRQLGGVQSFAPPPLG